MAEGHAILACALAQLKRGDAALAEADVALGLDPACVLAHGARSEAFLALGLRWHAELEAREALRIAPNDVHLVTDLAAILVGSTRYEEALAVVDRALTLHPQHVRALRMRALSLAFMNRPDEALAVLASALASDPDSPYLHDAVALALEKRANLEAAATAYRRALQIKPGDGVARRGLRRTTAPYRWLVPGHVTAWLRSRLF